MNKPATVTFTPDELSTLKALNTEFEYFYNDIFDLQALLTVFVEALWRMHDGTGALPTEDTLLPRFADIAEKHSYEIVGRVKVLYKNFHNLYCAKVEQFTEGGVCCE